MKLGNPVGRRKARFEIIPLIDIMFFLLASFMMVSLKMIHLQALRMDLPSPVSVTGGRKPDMIHLEVDPLGDAFVVQGQDRERKTLPDLLEYLAGQRAAHSNIPAYIKGHPQATHGQVIAVLDTCRRAGIHKVSYNITPPPRTE